MEPHEFHAKMDREKAAQVAVSEPAPESPSIWTDKAYSPWKISSQASRRRAKNAKRRALRRWRAKQKRADGQ